MKRILILLATLTLSAASAHGNEGKPVGQLRARDAHALLWLPDGRLLFGHHDGVQVSPDQGSTWKKLFDKPDFDAMNLQLAGRSIILAGHGVYATSPDGKRWMNRTPEGLGGKDLHGYAVDPGNAARHYAWEAGTGLYGSTDSGATWRPLTAQKLPPDVMKLAAGPKGTLYALSARAGLWRSTNSGKSFTALQTPEAQPTTLSVAADGALWVGGKSGVWRQQGHAWARISDEAALLIAVNPKRPAEAVWVDPQGAVHRTDH